MKLPLKLLVPLALGFLILFVVGIALGPIGRSFMGGEPFLPKPKIHLPADTVFHLGGLPVKNTVLASWFTMAFLAFFFYSATRRMKAVPGRFQLLAEEFLGMLLGLVEGAVGKDMARRVFPLVATIFLFVFFNALLALLPFFGPVGFLGEHGVVEKALFRNANTDMNQPLAIALIAVFMVEYWGIRTIGAGKYAGQFFNFRNLFHGGVITRFTGLIQLLVGAIEVVSHFIRLVSFTFRLFGNMTAGKTLLLIVAFLLPFFLIAADLAYGLELLLGLLQALIFSGLTLAFTAVAVTPHEEEHS